MAVQKGPDVQPFDQIELTSNLKKRVYLSKQQHHGTRHGISLIHVVTDFHCWNGKFGLCLKRWPCCHEY